MKKLLNGSAKKADTSSKRVIAGQAGAVMNENQYAEAIRRLCTLGRGQILGVNIHDDSLLEATRSYIECSIITGKKVANLRLPKECVYAIHYGNDRSIAIEEVKKSMVLQTPSSCHIVQLSTDPDFQIGTVEGMTSLSEKIPADVHCFTFCISAKSLQKEPAMAAFEALKKFIGDREIFVVMYVIDAHQKTTTLLQRFLTEYIEVERCEPDAGADVAMTVMCPNMLRLSINGHEKKMVQMRWLGEKIQFITSKFVTSSADLRAMLKMRAEGDSLEKIGDDFGFSKSTIQRKLSPFDVTKNVAKKPAKVSGNDLAGQVEILVETPAEKPVETPFAVAISPGTQKLRRHR